MIKIYSNKAPEAVGPYSQAMISGGMVYTSGQIGIDPAAGTITDNTIEGQTRQVMKNLKAVLDTAGSSLEKAVKTTCYLADINDFAAFNAIYEEYFTGKPARSCIAVKALPKGALVEVEVIAESTL